MPACVYVYQDIHISEHTLLSLQDTPQGLRVKGYYAGGLPIFAWTAYETNTGSFTHQSSAV